MSDRVCDIRADTGHCSCATGCAAKQLEEMREARDRAEAAMRTDKTPDVAPHEETWKTGEGALSGALYSGDTWIGSFTDPKRARMVVQAPALVRAILAEGSVIRNGPRGGQWHDYACHGEKECIHVCARKRIPLLAAGVIS